jgi:hypothetical protein
VVDPAKPGKKGFTLAGFFKLVFVLVLLLLGGLLFARQRVVQRLKVELEALVTARHRAVRPCPDVVGDPRDGDAFQHYRKAVEAVAAAKIVNRHGSVAGPDPAVERDLGKLRRFVDGHPLPLGQLSEGARAAQVVDPYDYRGDIFQQQLLDFSGIRGLAQLALADGYLRESGGDLAGAVTRYLEVLRFGGDLGRRGLLIDLALAHAVESLAGEAILGLLQRRDLPDAQLVELGRGLRAARPDMGRVALALEGDRVGMLQGMLSGDMGEQLAGSPPLERVAYQVGWPALDRLNADTVEAARLGDSGAVTARLKEIEASAQRSWNPIVARHATIPPGLHEASVEVDTVIRLLEVAVALERFRKAKGAYPGALSALAPDYLSPLPLDPFGPGQPLRYDAGSEGAPRVWSLYDDGRDDGGPTDPHQFQRNRDLGVILTKEGAP